MKRRDNEPSIVDKAERALDDLWDLFRRRPKKAIVVLFVVLVPSAAALIPCGGDEQPNAGVGAEEMTAVIRRENEAVKRLEAVAENLETQVADVPRALTREAQAQLVSICKASPKRAIEVDWWLGDVESQRLRDQLRRVLMAAGCTARGGGVATRLPFEGLRIEIAPDTDSDTAAALATFSRAIGGPASITPVPGRTNPRIFVGPRSRSRTSP